MAKDTLFEVRDTVNRASPAIFPVLDLEKSKDIPLPIQSYWSLDEYFKAIKTYISESELNSYNEELKKGFYNGLSHDNKKDVIRIRLLWIDW